jgi:hypothetical protein
VAEQTSDTAKEWLRIDGFQFTPKPGDWPLPPPPKGSGAITATDMVVACQFADKRRLLELRVTRPSAAEAHKVLGATQPLGAAVVQIEAELTGDMKDGGKLNFSVAEAKVSAAIKPLTMAQTLSNSALRCGGGRQRFKSA